MRAMSSSRSTGVNGQPHGSECQLVIIGLGIDWEAKISDVQKLGNCASSAKRSHLVVGRAENPALPTNSWADFGYRWGRLPFRSMADHAASGKVRVPLRLVAPLQLPGFRFAGFESSPSLRLRSFHVSRSRRASHAARMPDAANANAGPSSVRRTRWLVRCGHRRRVRPHPGLSGFAWAPTGGIGPRRSSDRLPRDGLAEKGSTPQPLRHRVGLAVVASADHRDRRCGGRALTSPSRRRSIADTVWSSGVPVAKRFGGSPEPACPGAS